MTDQAIHTGAVILGGGPAGLATAIALRQKGIDCLVVEPLEPAIDKSCGEGLMPDALASLRRLGVEITEEDGYLFHGIRFVNDSHQVQAHFPNGPGVGVRRTRLHQRLVAQAEEAGVRLLWNSRAQLLNSHSIAINNCTVTYQWLIGADGQASTVRQWAGLERTHKESLRFGLRRHYDIAPWSDVVEVHWGPPGQVYITPVAPDCLCVAFVTKDPGMVRQNFLDFFPALSRRLEAVPTSSRKRGAVSATRKLRQVASQSLALVGDASGSVDAVTGEGLAVSFRQALALADAIERGNLNLYNHAHKQISRLPHAMGSLMLAMDRWPGLERRAMKLLSKQPAFFDQLLSVHVGEQSMYRFVICQGPRFGWSLLTTDPR